MSVGFAVLDSSKGWDRQGNVLRRACTGNVRDEGSPDGCLQDPISHECLDERVVRLTDDGSCFNPSTLAAAWERKRENPITRVPYEARDEQALRKLAGLSLTPSNTAVAAEHATRADQTMTILDELRRNRDEYRNAALRRAVRARMWEAADRLVELGADVQDISSEDLRAWRERAAFGRRLAQ